MNLPELLSIAVGLSMDAFAVAISIGLTAKRAALRNALTAGAYFGVFQAVMPLIGYLLGISFAKLITPLDHWVAFILLAVIGGKMIFESLKSANGGESGANGSNGGAHMKNEASLHFSRMLPLAVATSIDALAVGISFAFLRADIIPAVSVIGATTLIISMAGVFIGKTFGARFKEKAEAAGGIILILIGLKILLEHLEILTL